MGIGRRFGTTAATAITAAVLLSGTTAAWARDEPSSPPMETVAGRPVALRLQGVGMVNLKPARFTLNLTFTAEGTTQAEAIAAFEQRAETLKAAVKAAGAGHTGHRPPVVETVGSNRFTALGRVEVGGTNPARLAQIIARARAAGIPGVGCEVSLYADKATEYKGRPAAMKAALEDATARARLFAEDARPRELSLLSMEEGDFATFPTTYTFLLDQEDPPPTNVGELMEVSVWLRYTLSDPAKPGTKPATKPAAAAPPAKVAAGKRA